MTFFQALRTFAKLCLAILGILILIFVTLRTLGMTQRYQRLQDSVLTKVNDYIYLRLDSNGLVSFESSQMLPPQLKNMDYREYTESPQITSLTPKKGENCLFLVVSFISEDYSGYQPILELFKSHICVFIQSPYYQVKEFFSRTKPRWFYGVSEQDWSRAEFLNSIGLETLAPLKGDFVFLKESPQKLQPRLFKELKRRDLIFFIAPSKNFPSIDKIIR